MKQYDKIYIPDEESGTFLITRERMEDSAPIHVTYASKEESVIVLTIEEAHDLWSAGHKRGWAECLHGEDESGRPDFTQYMKSVGIPLTN